MTGSVVTASFVMAAVGVYSARSTARAHAKICLRVGVTAGFIARSARRDPRRRWRRLVAEHQPVTFAAMEGHFYSEDGAALTLIGQPDVAAGKLENPIVVPWILSFLCYGSFGSTVHGLNDFPRDQWPQNVELLYYSYHIMAGLGTLFILTMGVATLLLWRGRLATARRCCCCCCC